MNWNVLVTRQIPQEGLDILKSHCERLDINPEDRAMTKEELLREVNGRDGILCLLTDTIDADIIQAADCAQIIANYAVGYNNIDVAYATSRSIMVTNTPGVLTKATADLTWALLFAAARRIPESDRYTRNGHFKSWGPMLLLGTDITGKTLGVIGAGRIGTAVALRSAGFRMKVLYADTSRNEQLESQLNATHVPVNQLLREADYISLHIPLTEETRHLIGSHELERMKSSAILINTSRGPVVDEKALVRALRTGEIAAAGLDVYENEPEIESGLIALDNTVLLPHTGSATVTARTRMAVMAAENLIAGLKGEIPPNLINQEVLGKSNRIR